MNHNPLLLVFVRNPVLGKVKTRLARSIGHQKALEVYKQLLSFTLLAVGGLNCQKRVYYADFVPASDAWQAAGFQPFMQVGEDLGDRMLDAFGRGFRDGFGPVLIIGSDCPGITPAIIEEALDLLRTVPVVIGPAADGGYYLLGMNRPLEMLFRNKPWSNSALLSVTTGELNHKGIDFRLLEVLSDIDEVADLDKFPGWFAG